MKGNGRGRRLSDRLFQAYGSRPRPQAKPAAGSSSGQLGWVGGLQIEQDLAFERRSWRIQRILWVVVGLVLLSALAGLTGRGPLSRVQAGSRGLGLEIRYQRYERLHAPAAVELVMRPADASDPVVSLWIERRYLEAFEIEQVVPEPLQSMMGRDHVRYDFIALRPGEPLAVRFSLAPRRAGLAQGRWGLDAGSRSVALRQYVYP
jgi:hypothetical protein